MGSSRFKNRRSHPPSSKATRLPLILVVDDDPHILAALNLSLRSHYACRLCKSGEEGLERLDDDVKAVILDVKMPGMNGFEVAAHIREQRSTLPIIFHSAFQNLGDPDELAQKYAPCTYL